MFKNRCSLKVILCWMITILIISAVHSFIQPDAVFGKECLQEDMKDLEKELYSFYEQNEEDRAKIIDDLVAQAELLVEKYEEDPDAYDAAATVLIKLGEFHQNPLGIYQKGIDLALQMRKLNDKEGRSYFWEASFMGEMGQLQGVFNSLRKIRPMKNKLEKALQEEPEFAPIHDVLARLYKAAPGWPISIGDMNKALYHRRKSVDLDPENVEYLWKLYKKYISLNRSEQAGRVLRKIVNMPEGARGEFYYGPQTLEDFQKKAEQELENNF